MNTSYLLLGSNMGDRSEYLREAVSHISNETGQIILKSSLYESEPWGKTDQPGYLNQALMIHTILSPQALLLKINGIEKKMGRLRKIKWDKRIIDIDILFYNDLILKSESLTIPHPYIHDRRFTLLPLSEIAPELNHPKFQKNIKTLLWDCEDKLRVYTIG